MSNYSARIIWQRNADELFTDRKYSRLHQWEFDGGVIVPASPSPHVVPAPYSSEANVDPEEAFVASLSSCHMLFFLDFAAREKILIDQYNDAAVGVMGKNNEGKIAFLTVTLRPQILIKGDNIPSAADIDALHQQAHAHCFIANSVKTDVVVESTLVC